MTKELQDLVWSLLPKEFKEAQLALAHVDALIAESMKDVPHRTSEPFTNQNGISARNPKYS